MIDFENGKISDDAINRISEMEEILDEGDRRMNDLEEKILEYRAFQVKIKELEDYYTSQVWKDDYGLDESGKLPANLKRGVLSEDGIYEFLERNKEFMERFQTLFQADDD